MTDHNEMSSTDTIELENIKNTEKPSGSWFGCCTTERNEKGASSLKGTKETATAVFKIEKDKGESSTSSAVTTTTTVTSTATATSPSTSPSTTTTATPVADEPVPIFGKNWGDVWTNLATSVKAESTFDLEDTVSDKDDSPSYCGVTSIVSGVATQYQATIHANSKRIDLGTFPTPKEAALAYDRAVLKYGHHKTKINFPNAIHKGSLLNNEESAAGTEASHSRAHSRYNTLASLSFVDDFDGDIEAKKKETKTKDDVKASPTKNNNKAKVFWRSAYNGVMQKLQKVKAKKEENTKKTSKMMMV